MIAQEELIKKGAKAIANVVYAALFYYILKWISGEKMLEFNLSLTLVTLIFVSISLILDYYEPVFKLTTENILFNQITQKGILAKIPSLVSFAF